MPPLSFVNNQFGPRSEHLLAQVNSLQHATIINHAIMERAIADRDVLKDHAVAQLAVLDHAVPADRHASRARGIRHGCRRIDQRLFDRLSRAEEARRVRRNGANLGPVRSRV